MMHREGCYDIIKGFAMLLVIIDHCGVPLWPVLDYLEVPAFFYVSGMLLSPKGTFSAFMWQKTKRLVAPYLLYSFAFVALCWWTLPVTWNIQTIGMSLLKPFNYPLWFLKALFWGLLIVRLLIAAKCFDNLKRSIVTALILCVIGTFIGCAEHMPEIALLSGLPQGLIATPMIAIGYVLRNVEFTDRIKALGFKKLLGIGLGLIALCAFAIRGNIHMQNANMGEWPILFYLFTTIVFFAFFCLANCVNRIPALQWCGRYSLQLFCIHAIPIQIAEYLFNH